MKFDDAPPVGALVVDQRGRVGTYMGTAGPRLMLRPLGGGCEWEAEPGSVRAPTPAERETVERARPARMAGDAPVAAKAGTLPLLIPQACPRCAHWADQEAAAWRAHDAERASECATFAYLHRAETRCPEPTP
ncbi:hypothetical protein ACWCQM_07780 [Streptomyces sp. NPDC002125]